MASIERGAPSRSPANNGAANQEHALLDFAQRLDRHREGRIAVHIHLSRLQSHNRREHHVRIAVDTFEELVKQFDGRIFVLANQDIIFICKGVRVEDLDKAVLKLRYLFSEDPLTRFSDASSEGGFCTWYRLEEDYKRFLALATRIHELHEAHQRDSASLSASSAEARRKPRRPLTPRILTKVVELLENADLSSLVRNQSICAFVADQQMQPVFDEKYVSIGDLERLILPDFSMIEDPWLFKYLTQTLDKRMLSQIQREIQGSDRAFSVNLNVSTVLSPDFQKFDQNIGVGVRGRLVIELQKVDIFADMGAYLFARDYLRERGYKICLDGLTYLTLPYIDRERLGLDLMKLAWSSELVDGLRPETLSELENHIRQAGRARIILNRCDSEAGIEFGRRMGISLFQGRHVDQLLNQNRPLSQRLGSVRYR